MMTLWRNFHLAYFVIQVIERKIIEINAKIKSQLNCIQEINNFFTKLPEFTRKIESISSDLGKYLDEDVVLYRFVFNFKWRFVGALQRSTAEVEEFLVIFEDVVETEEMKQKEVEERFQFASYIERRSTETDALKSNYFHLTVVSKFIQHNWFLLIYRCIFRKISRSIFRKNNGKREKNSK